MNTEELKSLKNPTRLLTIFMFLAVFVSSIGAEGLSQLFPGLPPAALAGIVAIAGYIVTQYGTERRIVRAEEIKDQEYTNDNSNTENLDAEDSAAEELIEDGV